MGTIRIFIASSSELLHNIIIQGVNESSITVNVNGQSQQIEKKLDALQSLMEQMAVKSVQSADNIYKGLTALNFHPMGNGF